MNKKYTGPMSIFLLLAFSAATLAQSTEETLYPPPGVAYFVASSEDDAEEGANGQIDLANGDLDLGQISGFESAVAIGLRFAEIRIPSGSIIESAFLQFTADGRGPKDAATDLTIRGELAANAESFSDEPNNISSRSLTEEVVSWSPDTWYEDDGRSPRQQSPDLSGLIQEVIDQKGWAEGNALVIVIAGNGERDAMSFDGGGSEAGPMLFIKTK